MRRAEARLDKEEPGVLDEIGFLAIHQAYADRFFPGTSVLQTRLRYVLLVPWLYGLAAGRAKTRTASQFVRDAEVNLAGRLKKHDADGVIGSRTYPRPTTQPAAMVYWTALGTWGILRRKVDGSWPSRASVHRTLDSWRVTSSLTDDDDVPLEFAHSPFVRLPATPAALTDPAASISLAIEPDEARFIRAHLVALRSGGTGAHDSLLARLVDRRVNVRGLDVFWLPEVLDAAAPEDRQAIERSRRAAALAAVGRGVYAALLEQARDVDGVPTEQMHRTHLQETVDLHRVDAVALDLEHLVSDAPRLHPPFLALLRDTQDWLASHGHFEDLRGVYTAAEFRRKGVRARLARTPHAIELRREWQPETHAMAVELHYRWPQVRRLLADLWNARA